MRTFSNDLSKVVKLSISKKTGLQGSLHMMSSKASFPRYHQSRNVPKTIEDMKEVLDQYPRKVHKIMVLDDCLGGLSSSIEFNMGK